MIILDTFTLLMVIDEKTTVSWWKASVYGLTQVMIGISNLTLGLTWSASMLFIGACLWLTLAFQSSNQKLNKILDKIKSVKITK